MCRRIWLVLGAATVVVTLATTSANAAPRWQFTDAATWEPMTGAPVPDRLSIYESRSVAVTSADQAKAAVSGAGKVPVSLEVKAGDVCAIAPVLAKLGPQIALKVDDTLTPAASACIVAIAPSALTIDDGNNLPNLPTLRALAIITHTDLDLAAIATHRTLESLAIGGNVSDKGLADVGSLPALRALVLFGADKVGLGLTKLTRIQSLALINMTVQRAQLAAVGTLKNLRSLDLYAGVDGEDLVALAPLAKLATLRVRHDALPAALEPLGKLRSLRSLVIEGMDRDDAVVAMVTAWARTHRSVRIHQKLFTQTREHTEQVRWVHIR